MNEPTDECVIDFWANGAVKKLPVSSSNPRFIRAASVLRESCTDKKTCRKMLADDYHRLFDENGLFLAAARTSVYLGQYDGFSNKSLNPGEFYNSYGWHLKPRGEKPDDHLGIELLFLTKLIDKYLQLDDEPCCSEMKKEIQRYIDLYLLSWIPMWNEDIQEHAGTWCYKGIGTLIHAIIEDLNGIFSTNTSSMS